MGCESGALDARTDLAESARNPHALVIAEDAVAP
jgi:hypothetical protein